MYCNLGKFCENGQCGYVLKPPIMRHDAPPGSFDPTCVDKPFPSSTVRKLKVTVINARQLPKIKWDRDSEVVDPFVILSCEYRLTCTAALRCISKHTLILLLC